MDLDAAVTGARKLNSDAVSKLQLARNELDLILSLELLAGLGKNRYQISGIFGMWIGPEDRFLSVLSSETSSSTTKLCLIHTFYWIQE